MKSLNTVSESNFLRGPPSSILSVWSESLFSHLPFPPMSTLHIEALKGEEINPGWFSNRVTVNSVLDTCSPNDSDGRQYNSAFY